MLAKSLDMCTRDWSLVHKQLSISVQVIEVKLLESIIFLGREKPVLGSTMHTRRCHRRAAWDVWYCRQRSARHHMRSSTSMHTRKTGQRKVRFQEPTIGMAFVASSTTLRAGRAGRIDRQAYRKIVWRRSLSGKQIPHSLVFEEFTNWTSNKRYRATLLVFRKRFERGAGCSPGFAAHRKIA